MNYLIFALISLPLFSSSAIAPPLSDRAVDSVQKNIDVSSESCGSRLNKQKRIAVRFYSNDSCRDRCDG